MPNVRAEDPEHRELRSSNALFTVTGFGTNNGEPGREIPYASSMDLGFAKLRGGKELSKHGWSKGNMNKSGHANLNKESVGPRCIKAREDSIEPEWRKSKAGKGSPDHDMLNTAGGMLSR